MLTGARYNKDIHTYKNTKLHPHATLGRGNKNTENNINSLKMVGLSFLFKIHKVYGCLLLCHK